MDANLKKYILDYCREWMSAEEKAALRRTLLNPELERKYRNRKLLDLRVLYGFDNPDVNKLVDLGQDKLQNKIAERIYFEHKDEILNLCPRCSKLARTPSAKQCRFCQYDWH